jgi:hypothetical protein
MHLMTDDPPLSGTDPDSKAVPQRDHPLKYAEHRILSMKNHPQFNELWVHQRIAERPSLLGLGEVELRDWEKAQPGAGRLDILLYDPASKVRYETEVQLGSTDPRHIIRTIEYWDIERRRYPQYEHCAVLVAEDITSRFLNVIALFNGHIPLIAIRLSAIEVNGAVILVTTKVMDQMTLGTDEEDEPSEPADRKYWETHATPATVALADRVLELVKEFQPALDLKYNKYYIGLAQNGLPNNFVTVRPQKKNIIVRFKLPQSDELVQRLTQAGIEVLDYDARWHRLPMRLVADDLKLHRDILRDVVHEAFDAYGQ